MEDANEFAKRFFTELTSYAPIVLPTLFIYVLESDSSLKLWHAVQQIPHLEKGAAVNDVESNIDAAHQAKIVATREAVKKEVRREAIGSLSLYLILVAVFLFEQYVIFSGMLIRAREEDDLEDYVVVDPEELGSESVEGYNWYYNSTYGQINWTRFYYPTTLFFPAVFLITRALYLLSGLKDRVVLRSTRGNFFMLLVPTDRFQLRRPALATIAVVAAALVLACGAFWFHNLLCSAIVFASLIHFLVSSVAIPNVVGVKNHIISGAIFFAFLALLFIAFSDLENAWPFRLHLAVPVGNLDWSALIYTAFTWGVSFNIISRCYRMDHALACPGEFLVGPPDINCMAQTPLAVRGIRLSYSFFRNLKSSTPRARFRKPYFHTAVWSWLGSYAIVAALSALGYISCRADSAGWYTLYITQPLMCFAVFLRAAVRGEVKKLWEYKEDWARNPIDKQAVMSGPALVEIRPRKLDVKPLVAGESEKGVLQA